MCNSAALLLLIITFVGAEEKLTSQASPAPAPVKDADTGNVNEVGIISGNIVAGDPQTQHHHLFNQKDFVSGTEEQTKVAAQKVEKTNDERSEQRKEIKMKLNEEKETVPESKNQAVVQEEKEERVTENSEETEDLKRKINDQTGQHDNVWQVSERCLDCLCRFTGCKLPTSETECRDVISCGPFGLCYEYWEDAFNYKKPDTKSLKGDANMEKKWRVCSVDLKCSTEAIQKYFNKYPIDCNQDGKVDCLDYTAIHMLGPFGCQEKKNIDQWNKGVRKSMLKCLVSEEEGVYVKKMRELQGKSKSQDNEAEKMEEGETNKTSDQVKVEVQTAARKSEGKTIGGESGTLEHIRGGIVQV